MSPPVSVVVVTYGKQHLARNLLESLREHPDRSLIRDIVIVDNGYPEQGDSRTHVSGPDYPFPVRFVQSSDRSYSAGINRGAAVCDGPILIVSNSDVEWLPGFSIAPVVEHLQAHRDLGIAAPQLVFPDGRWQRSGGPFPSIREGIASLLMMEVIRNGIDAAWHARGAATPRPRDVGYVDGAFMVIARPCFDALGGFDPDFEFYGEDADFSWRAARAGWRRVHVPAARIMHVRGASSSLLAAETYIRRLFAGKKQFVRKAFGDAQATWYDRLQRAGACEYALVYFVIAALWRTPAWRYRADSAAAMARVVLAGD